MPSPIVITARHLLKRAPERVVLGEAAAEAVEALGDLLARVPGEVLRAECRP